VSSRLGLDSRGRRIVVVTSPSCGLEVGDRFLVLGNTITCDVPDEPGHFFFLGRRTGRPNGASAPRRNARDPLPVDAAKLAA
jgi:hypothetical protein